MSQIPREPELGDIESALAALLPAPSRLDRDRLMFEAGASSGRMVPSRRWAWPSAAAVLAMAVAVESLLLATRPPQRVVERPVVIHEPSTPEAPGFATNEPKPPSSPATTPDRRSSSEERPLLAGLARMSSDPLDLVLSSPWVTVGDSRAVRAGREGLPEPARRAVSSGGPVGGTGSSPSSVGELRRLGLERWLNPGDRS